MNKRKKIILAISIVIFLMVVFLVYRLYMFSRYRIYEMEINTDSIFTEVLTIPDKSNNSVDVIKYNKMTIDNYFDGYVENANNPEMKIKYDENGKVVSHYTISSLKQYVNYLSVNSFKLNADPNKSFDTEKSMKKFLNKNNIINDIDLLGYMKENYYIKSNILMCTRTMRNNYILNSFVQTTLPEFTKMVLLNGHVTGYIISVNDMKDIRLLNGDEQYVILLAGDELTTDEFIIKLLSSVRFSN